MKKNFLFLLFFILLPQLQGTSRNTVYKTKKQKTNYLSNEKLLQLKITFQEKRNLKKTINSMPLDQKIGQLFLIGFAGTQITPEIKRAMRDIKPGGIILFKYNFKSYEQIKYFNLNLQKESSKYTSFPLFLSVDQEGDIVSRIIPNEPIPSHLSIGKTKNKNIARYVGLQNGNILYQLGFNMNFAPVADTYSPKSTHFLFNRTFSKNLSEVENMAFNYSKGLLQAGVIPVIKHFPGHGEFSSDSHRTLPKRNISEPALIKEASVYKNIFYKLPVSVMSGHLTYPKITKDNEPASLSPYLLKSILRKKLGFHGMIITDDIIMKAVKDKYPLKEVAEKSILAGANIVMISWSPKEQKEVAQYIKKRVLSKKIPLSVINNRLEKILTQKILLQKIKDQNSNWKQKVIKAEDRMRQVNKKIITQNLNESFFIHLRKKKIKKIIFFSNQKKICQLFQKGFKGEIATCSHPKYLRTLLRSEKQTLFVFYLTLPSRKYLNSKYISLLDKRNIFLVNSMYPDAIRVLKNKSTEDRKKIFAGFANIYTANDNIGYYLGQKFRSIKEKLFF